MADQSRATRGFHERIALVFDFDRTLSSGTIDALLDAMGVEDSSSWREERLKAMVEDGWDEILAKGRLLADTAAEQKCDLSREFIEEVGRGLGAYPGVEETMAELRERGRQASGGGAVELHILSSGFVDMMAVSPVARCFDSVWGSSLHWGEDGRLLGVKRAVIHSEKARYLLALAKGLDIVGANEPQDVHKPRPRRDWHLQLDQLAYVGDGASDIAAFELVQENGGIAIAVDHSGKGGTWEASEHMFEDARVENLAPPDFSEGSEMRRSLLLSAEILGKRVALRALAQGE